MEEVDKKKEVLNKVVDICQALTRALSNVYWATRDGFIIISLIRIMRESGISIPSDVGAIFFLCFVGRVVTKHLMDRRGKLVKVEEDGSS